MNDILTFNVNLMIHMFFQSCEESTPFLTRSSVISFQDLYVIVLKMRKFLCTYICPTICILYFLVWGFIVYYLLSIRILYEIK